MSVEISEDLSILELLDEEWELPCEVQDLKYMPTPHGSAKWVAHARCEACRRSSARLICTSCKDYICATYDGVKCRNCDEPHIPFRRLFSRFEAL